MKKNDFFERENYCYSKNGDGFPVEDKIMPGQRVGQSVLSSVVNPPGLEKKKIPENKFKNDKGRKLGHLKKKKDSFFEPENYVSSEGDYDHFIEQMKAEKKQEKPVNMVSSQSKPVEQKLMVKSGSPVVLKSNQGKLPTAQKVEEKKGNAGAVAGVAAALGIGYFLLSE